MRLVPMHTATTSPSLGDPMEPRQNTVGIQMSLEGDGAVTGTVQIKGRIDIDAPLEDIGTEISMSGTASPGTPVSETVTLTALSAAYIFADLSAVSAISFRAIGSEAEQ